MQLHSLYRTILFFQLLSSFSLLSAKNRAKKHTRKQRKKKRAHAYAQTYASMNNATHYPPFDDETPRWESTSGSKENSPQIPWREWRHGVTASYRRNPPLRTSATRILRLPILQKNTATRQPVRKKGNFSANTTWDYDTSMWQRPVRGNLHRTNTARIWQSPSGPPQIPLCFPPQILGFLSSISETSQGCLRKTLNKVSCSPHNLTGFPPHLSISYPRKIASTVFFSLHLNMISYTVKHE